jgi:methanogenic corrinoid protein MtbC1
MAALRQGVVTENWLSNSEEVSTDLGAADSAPLGAFPRRPLDLLSHAIRAEIIPRIVLSRAAPPVPAGGPAQRIPGVRPSAKLIAEFADIVLLRDEATAYAYIAASRDRGVPLEDIYLDLLAPTARCLGDMWGEDQIDFTQVTVGVWRLHQVLHEFGPAFQHETRQRELGLMVLLVPGPGEQHTFGLSMVGEFFRRAGWLVRSGPWATTNDLANMVRGENFSLIGFSLSSETRLDSLANDIRVVRRVSRNRKIGVMVGGRVFSDHPQSCADIGADGMAADGRQAPFSALQLVSALERRS